MISRCPTAGLRVVGVAGDGELHQLALRFGADPVGEHDAVVGLLPSHVEVVGASIIEDGKPSRFSQDPLSA
jgi:hypothetical protein